MSLSSSFSNVIKYLLHTYSHICYSCMVYTTVQQLSILCLTWQFCQEGRRETVALLCNSVLLPVANSCGYNQVFVQPDLLIQSVLLLASHDFQINCDQQCVSIKNSSCPGTVVSMRLFSLLGPPPMNVSEQSWNKVTFFFLSCRDVSPVLLHFTQQLSPVWWLGFVYLQDLLQ